MYDIDLKNVKKGRKVGRSFLGMGLFFLIVVGGQMFMGGGGEFDLSDIRYIGGWMFMVVPVLFICLGLLDFVRVKKRVEQIKRLNQRGKLVKGMPYRLLDLGVKANGAQVKRPVVVYTLPSGNAVTLVGDARFDGRMADADGLVDLVIDESDPENFFIDFEINRLTGNLPSDYYQPAQGELE